VGGSAGDKCEWKATGEGEAADQRGGTGRGAGAALAVQRKHYEEETMRALGESYRRTWRS